MGLIFNARDGETPLDNLSGLKVKIPHITRSQLDMLEAENIQLCIEKYLGMHKKKALNFNGPFFSKLHQEMFGRVWKWAGSYRTSDTNIGSRKELIAQDIIILEKDIQFWDKTLEGAVRLHHRAVQIHPFAGGNGRWSRLLSELWLRQNCGQFICWPEGMEKESHIRDEYLAALRQADGLNYEPLLWLHQRYVRNV